jgi:predicted GNAT family acetyltransferase
MAEITTRHDAEQARYVALLDGEEIGELVYRDTEEGRVFTHSVIVPEHEHHGFGTQMVRAGLDDTRGAGIKPIGQCSLVRNFLAEHPDYTRPSR